MTLIMSIVISITFLIVRLLPGDPILLVVGDRPTLEQIEKAQNDHDFDKPLHKQYISFLKKTISLDLGVSLRTKQPVLDEINRRFSATLELVFFSMLVSIIVGFPMGIVSALKKGKKIDVLFRGFSYVGLSLPVFWLAMILQIVFFGLLNWFPLQGRYSASAFIDDHTVFHSGFIFLDTLFSGDLSLFLDALEHIVLPGTTMAFGVLVKGPIIFIFTILPLIAFSIIQKKNFFSLIWTNIGFLIFLVNFAAQIFARIIDSSMTSFANR